MVANYTALFSGNQMLQMLLSTGKSIIGTFEPHGFTLGNCEIALQFIPAPSRCRFSYVAPS
jgi:hypothetical protein